MKIRVGGPLKIINFSEELCKSINACIKELIQYLIHTRGTVQMDLISLLKVFDKFFGMTQFPIRKLFTKSKFFEVFNIGHYMILSYF